MLSNDPRQPIHAWVYNSHNIIIKEYTYITERNAKKYNFSSLITRPSVISKHRDFFIVWSYFSLTYDSIIYYTPVSQTRFVGSEGKNTHLQCYESNYVNEFTNACVRLTSTCFRKECWKPNFLHQILLWKLRKQR